MVIDIERIKHKIRALLARNTQNGASVAEAETCLEKAYQLLTQFNLDIEELLRDSDPGTQKVIKEQVYENGNISPELWELYCQIAWLFHCEAIRSRRYVQGSKYRRVFISVIGNPINVEKVRYFMVLFEDIVRQIIKFENITGLRNINSFKRGFYLAIAQKAQTLRLEVEEKEEEQQKQNTGTSLVVLDKKNIDEFISLEFPNLKAKSNNFNNYGKATNLSAYQSGQSHGSTINFHDPLGASRGRISCQL